MGATRLRLVRPCEFTDETRYMAWNATAVVDRAESFSSMREAIADCTRVYGFTARSGRFREGYGSLPRRAGEMVAHPGPIALVFGREDAGLRVEEYELCHELLRIPTRGASSSLNLSQAVMVVLSPAGEVRTSTTRSRLTIAERWMRRKRSESRRASSSVMVSRRRWLLVPVWIST